MSDLLPCNKFEGAGRHCESCGWIRRAHMTGKFEQKAGTDVVKATPRTHPRSECPAHLAGCLGCIEGGGR